MRKIENDYKGEIEMAKNKVKVMGPKINATKEIDITDFKLNGRFDVIRKREVVFDKNSMLNIHLRIKMR